MTARRLMAFIAAIVLGFSALPAKSTDERAYIEVLIQYYAQYYDVPVDLVRRVVHRESTFNPRARNGPYWGLMQILPATAHTMGYRGTPEGLLDAETNLIYAVKYLRGAYLVADGNHDRAVQLYARGYYYDARDKGLLEETGLRPGPKSPVAPQPIQVAAAPVTFPQPLFQFAPAAVASLAPAEAPAQAVAAPTPLGFLPPSRPATLPPNAALAAIAVAAAEPEVPEQEPSELERSILTASAYMGSQTGLALRPSLDMFEGTFQMLEAMAAPPAGTP